jgi:hypothetical protein
VVTIACEESWDVRVTVGGEVAIDKTARDQVVAGFDPDKNKSRCAIRWSLDDLLANPTVTKVELHILVPINGEGEVSGLWDIQPYDNDGQTDPCSETGLTFYNHCNPATTYVNDTTEFRTIGWKTFDLGAQACADVEAAKAAVNRFSLGIHEEGDNDDATLLVGRGALGANAAELIITYEEEAPPATVLRRLLVGVGL